jgi:hypothetical protein
MQEEEHREEHGLLGDVTIYHSRLHAAGQQQQQNSSSSEGGTEGIYVLCGV